MIIKYLDYEANALLFMRFLFQEIWPNSQWFKLSCIIYRGKGNKLQNCWNFTWIIPIELMHRMMMMIMTSNLQDCFWRCWWKSTMLIISVMLFTKALYFSSNKRNDCSIETFVAIIYKILILKILHLFKGREFRICI